MANASASAEARKGLQSESGDVLGVALASGLLFGVGQLLPPLSAVASLPLMIQRVRRGLAAAAMATALAAAALGAVFSVGSGLLFLLGLALPGLLLTEALVRGRGLRTGSFWAFGVLLAQVVVTLLLAGEHLARLALSSFETTRSEAFLEQMRQGGLPAERVQRFAEDVVLFESAMRVVYPAAFVVMAAVVVLLQVALLRAWLVRRDPGWLEDGEFESTRWPLGLAVVFVLAGATVFLPPLRPAGYNVLLVVAFFYALQGLAVVTFYAYRLAGPPVLRVALVVLVLMMPWAPVLLAGLGLFDTWLDLRRWARLPAADEGR